MYIPSYPLELFHVVREEKGKKIEGTQCVAMMSGEIKDLDVIGLDFPLAMNVTTAAAEHIRDFNGVRTNLTMLAADEDDRQKWKVESEVIFNRQKDDQANLSLKQKYPQILTSCNPTSKEVLCFFFL